MQKNNKNNHNKNFLSEKTNSKEKETQKGIVKREISQFLSMSSHSLNPLSKLSEDNINKMLENDDKHDERKFKDKKEKRIFIIILSIFFGLLILSILFIFKDNIELLRIILPSIISLAVGVLGGYGYGYKKGRDFDD